MNDLEFCGIGVLLVFLCFFAGYVVADYTHSDCIIKPVGEVGKLVYTDPDNNKLEMCYIATKDDNLLIVSCEGLKE